MRAPSQAGPGLVRTALWMSALYGAYSYPYSPEGCVTRAIDAYLYAQAWAVAALLRPFDAVVSATETVIQGRFALQLVKSCSSLDALALWAAAVLAHPAQARWKALGLLAGFAGLTALNVVRIAALYLVGARAPAWFDAVHERVLPLALLGFASFAFAAWARHGGRAAARTT